MSNKNTIYFRADGDGVIGYGHVMRSLALAAMLKEEYVIVFIARESTRLLEAEIKKESNEMIWIPNHIELKDEALYLSSNIKRNSIAVTDGYFFDTAYQVNFKKIFRKLVCIDDLHEFTFVADVVVNQSGCVSRNDYELQKETNLCVGLDYLLLRKPFLHAAKNKRKIHAVEKAFVCFGGSDYFNITSKAVEALLLHPSITEIHVVIGSAYAFKEKLFSLITSSKTSVFVYEQISAEKMCEIMQICDIAIAPSSSVSFELCSVGIGLVCGYYVDNQKDIYKYSKEKKVIIPAGDLSKISVKELYGLIPTKSHVQELLENQSKYFNGQSAVNFKLLFRELQ